MTALAPRRAFLRGLISLPLVGGAVELIGNPRAVAMPVTNQLMFEYLEWLRCEKARVTVELHDSIHTRMGLRCEEENAAYRFAAFLDPQRPLPCERWSHGFDWHRGAPPAATRAALVLASVGCDWRRPYP